MAQTRDGWLWIGSTSGLFRFDGMRFRRFEPPGIDGGIKRHVTSLTALADGGLLIGYFSGGLDLVRDGRVTHLPSQVDATAVGAVFSAVLDSKGTIWTATTTGLLQLQGKAWREVGAIMGLPPGRVSNLTLDQYGQIWIAAGRKLFVLAPGSARFREVLDGVSTVNLGASPDGRLWLDTHEELIPVPPQQPGPVQPRPDWMAQASGEENGLFDRDGNYWMLACPVGLCRADGIGGRPSQVQRPIGEVRNRLDQAWQVSSLTGNILFEDRDGNMWVGTQNGVERFRHNRLRPLRLSDGTRHVSFARDTQGQAWANERPSGKLWRLLADGRAELKEQLPASQYGVIAGAADGAVLVPAPGALERRYPDRVERIAYPPAPQGATWPGGTPPLSRLIDDGAGIWMTIASLGTFRQQGGGWTDSAALGIPKGNFFAAAGRRGEIWFGYRDGLAYHFDNGKVLRYGPQQGLDVGSITFMHAGEQVIAGGQGGLAVMAAGRFRSLRAADPEVLSSISGLVIDPNGDRWFNGSRGVVFVSAAQWRAALADAAGELQYTLLGVLDGYPGAAATANRQPSALGAADGRIWFAGSTGVAWLDRGKLAQRSTPPRALVETVAAKGVRYSDFAAPLWLKAGSNAFRIEFTALSYAMPEMLRFRYKLDGVDEQWQDSGTRRAISYTNVGPGSYRFRLSAIDSAGQASEQEARIELVIPPTFTQTGYFYALCLFLLAGVAYGAYLLRLKQLERRFQERIAERERIARTLHDTFLQSVQSLILGFHAAMLGLPSGAAREKMERVLESADRVMEEGRDQVHDLRSAARGDGNLGRALAAMAEGLRENHGSLFELAVDGQARALSDKVADDVYYIAREALINAFRHAAAAHIRVDIVYGRRQFSVLVADDGIGMDAALLESGYRAGHWGLPGMAERAARFGAALSFDSAPGKGSRIKLSVPAARAYGRFARWRSHW